MSSVLSAWTFNVLPVLPSPGSPPPGFVGTRHGKVRVLGYAGRSSSGARWVCRCDCGRYATRRMVTLRQGADPCPCGLPAEPAPTGEPALDDAAALSTPKAIARYLASVATAVGDLPPNSPALRLASVLAGEIEWAIGHDRARREVAA